MEHPQRERTHRPRGTHDRVLGLAKAMAHRKFAGYSFSAWIIPEFRAVLLQAMVDAKLSCSSIHVHAWPWAQNAPVPEASEQTDMDTL